MYELDLKATGKTTRRVNQRVLEPLKESIRYPGFKPGQVGGVARCSVSEMRSCSVRLEMAEVVLCFGGR